MEFGRGRGITTAIVRCLLREAYCMRMERSPQMEFQFSRHQFSDYRGSMALTRGDIFQGLASALVCSNLRFKEFELKLILNATAFTTFLTIFF